MREQCKNIRNKLFKIGYYLLAIVLIVAFLGIFFDYSNKPLNQLLGLILFIYSEFFLSVLIILKYFDLKEDYDNKRVLEFTPSRSNMGDIILYIVIAFSILSMYSNCN